MTYIVVSFACTGIEVIPARRFVIVQMHGKEEQPRGMRIHLDDLLGAVAVVNVQVDDRDTFAFVFLQRMKRPRRHVVEDAKAAGIGAV